MKEQQKYIESILSAWRTKRQNAIGGPYYSNLSSVLPMPRRVRQAEKQIKRLQKIIGEWERQAKDMHKRQLAFIDQQYRAAREKILFSTPKEALAFVKKLR